MEREPICYVCEGKEQINSLKRFWRFLKNQLEYKIVYFQEQAIVEVYIPLWERKEKHGFLGKILQLFNSYYIHKVQSKLWDILLKLENTSVQPAFCSTSLYERFGKESMLKNELWLTTQLPEELIRIALFLFLKKECTFRKETRVFIIDEGSIELEDALYPYCSKLNFLQFLVKKKECHEEFVREVYEESGLAIAITTKKENAMDADLILDLGKEELLDVEHIKKGCIYFDGYSHKSLEKKLRMRGDILYFSTWNYLNALLQGE